jgi:hypothetical protein
VFLVCLGFEGDVWRRWQIGVRDRRRAWLAGGAVVECDGGARVREEGDRGVRGKRERRGSGSRRRGEE